MKKTWTTKDKMKIKRTSGQFAGSYYHEAVYKIKGSDLEAKVYPSSQCWCSACRYDGSKDLYEAPPR